MTGFIQTLRNKCEEDQSGFPPYPTRESCLANLDPLPPRGDELEIMYQTLMLDPELALQASPSDPMEILFRETGVRVDTTKYANNLLWGYYTHDWLSLYTYKEACNFLFRTFLERKLDPFYIMMLRLMLVAFPNYGERLDKNWYAIYLSGKVLMGFIFQGRFTDQDHYPVLLFPEMNDEELKDALQQAFIARILSSHGSINWEDGIHHPSSYTNIVEEAWPWILDYYGYLPTFLIGR